MLLALPFRYRYEINWVRELYPTRAGTPIGLLITSPSMNGSRPSHRPLPSQPDYAVNVTTRSRRSTSHGVEEALPMKAGAAAARSRGPHAADDSRSLGPRRTLSFVRAVTCRATWGETSEAI